MSDGLGYLDTIQSEIEKIQETNGFIDPKRLVDASRSKDAPLHRYFEWDDAVAAESHRVNQARNMINKVKVRILDKPSQAYVAVRVTLDDSSEKRGYMPLLTAVRRKDLREQIVAKALREIDYWQQRFSQYEELAHIVDDQEVKKTKQKLQKSK